MKRVVFALAMACCIPAGAHAAVIYPISAVGSSDYPGYPSIDAIDQGAGSAVSDWASLGQGAASYLDLDLGEKYDLTSAYVTDRVTSGGPNNTFVGGLYDFTTRFSLQAYTDATFTTAIGSAIVVTHAAPAAPSSPSDFEITVGLGGLDAQFLRYQVLATNGSNPGLSDIHFSGAAVPEPASWMLMIGGFGFMGAALRRRAFAAPHKA